MEFVKQMLEHAEQNMEENDKDFWRKEALRLGLIPQIRPLDVTIRGKEIKIPRDLDDEELQDWLCQSDYANQFAY